MVRHTWGVPVTWKHPHRGLFADTGVRKLAQLPGGGLDRGERWPQLARLPLHFFTSGMGLSEDQRCLGKDTSRRD